MPRRVPSLVALAGAGRPPRPPSPPPAAEDADAVKARYTKYEYRIPMRDGVKLFTVRLRAQGRLGARYPILLNAHAVQRRPLRRRRSTADSLGPVARCSREEGYIFVYQDVRGRWMSEGEFVNMRPHKPAKSGRRTSTRAPTPTTRSTGWSRTCRTTTARSACGASPIRASTRPPGMIDAHPALKAVSPQAPIADWFVGDDFHHNGASVPAALLQLLSPTFGQPATRADAEAAAAPFDHGTPDGYEFFLELGPLANADKQLLQGRDRVLERGRWQPRHLRRVLEGAQPPAAPARTSSRPC